MINLGFNSGKGLPNVYVELTPIDRILEGLAVLLMTAAWVLAIVFYYNSPVGSTRLFIGPCSMIVFTVVFIWASRAPIRLYSFPVKVNERNYVMQYVIASRFTRVINLIGNLTLFCTLLIELESQLNVSQGLFTTCMYATFGLLLLSFVVYYFFAFRYR